MYIHLSQEMNAQCNSYVSICTLENVRKLCAFKCHTPSWEPYRMARLFCILCTVQTWLHSFLGNLSWHWREEDLETSIQFKNSVLLCAVQTVEKMVDIFVRDRALKEHPLCRNQYGCWSATSIETSVADVIYMNLECSWTWWPYKEHLLIMWEHLKLFMHEGQNFWYLTCLFFLCNFCGLFYFLYIKCFIAQWI